MNIKYQMGVTHFRFSTMDNSTPLDPLAQFMMLEAGQQYRANRALKHTVRELHVEILQVANERDQLRESNDRLLEQNRVLIAQALVMERKLEVQRLQLFRTEYSERLYKRQLRALQEEMLTKVTAPRRLPDGWIRKKRTVHEAFEVAEHIELSDSE